MFSQIRAAVVITILMTLLTGILYPLAMTGLAQTFFPKQANGSLIDNGGKVIGSSLIGQSFTSEKYFYGRPSATTTADPADATKTISAPYNASSSSGSNLGPTSQALMDGIKTTSQQLHQQNPKPIPVDLVTASGSGLDPHISPAAADFQISRVAKARNLTDSQVADIVKKHTTPRALGIFGEPVVNVLELNIDLDTVASH